MVTRLGVNQRSSTAPSFEGAKNAQTHKEEPIIRPVFFQLFVCFGWFYCKIRFWNVGWVGLTANSPLCQLCKAAPSELHRAWYIFVLHHWHFNLSNLCNCHKKHYPAKRMVVFVVRLKFTVFHRSEEVSGFPSFPLNEGGLSPRNRKYDFPLYFSVISRIIGRISGATSLETALSASNWTILSLWQHLSSLFVRAVPDRKLEKVFCVGGRSLSAITFRIAQEEQQTKSA